jgi:predicted TIM-barrel fold metal-dependent hydrolase
MTDSAAQPKAAVVDTHVHAGTTKYEPVASLLDQMGRHGVDHAVLIQHMGMFDNDYLIACAQAHPGRFAVACLVDVHTPGAANRLDDLVERHRSVQGIRLYLTDLFAGEPGARALWERADALGLNITVAGTLGQLASDEMQATARRYTRARLHLEHLCHPDPKEEAPYPTYRRALSLADLDHCVLKVSGFYSFTSSPWSPYLDTLRFVDLSLEAFGPTRMMWGSDFPPFARHHIAIVDHALRAQLMGGTATRFWDFHVSE